MADEIRNFLIGEEGEEETTPFEDTFVASDEYTEYLANHWFGNIYGTEFMVYAKSGQEIPKDEAERENRRLKVSHRLAFSNVTLRILHWVVVVEAHEKIGIIDSHKHDFMLKMFPRGYVFLDFLPTILAHFQWILNFIPRIKGIKIRGIYITYPKVHGTVDELLLHEDLLPRQRFMMYKSIGNLLVNLELYKYSVQPLDTNILKDIVYWRDPYSEKIYYLIKCNGDDSLKPDGNIDPADYATLAKDILGNDDNYPDIDARTWKYTGSTHKFIAACLDGKYTNMRVAYAQFPAVDL